jgi:integrase
MTPRRTTPAVPAAPLARRTAGAVVADAAGARLPTYVTRAQARAVIAAAQSTRDRLLFACLWQTGGRVTEGLRLRRGDVDAREGALRLTNPEQRRRALREKLVYVSAELLRDLVHYAKDLRLGPGDHFFPSRKTDAPGAAARPPARRWASRGRPGTRSAPGRRKGCCTWWWLSSRDPSCCRRAPARSPGLRPTRSRRGS